MDPRRREALLLPTVTFVDRRPPRKPPRGGGTTSDRARAAPVEHPLAGRLVRGGITALLVLLAGYAFSCASVLLQEFETRRDIDRVRAHLIALDAEGATVVADDVVAAVRAVAAGAGVEIARDDIEIIAAPVGVRDRPGDRCALARLPAEFDRLSLADRRRFDGSPIKCDQTRWIVGFRATARASSLLRTSRFTLERYTWVDGFLPDGGEVIAANR